MKNKEQVYMFWGSLSFQYLMNFLSLRHTAADCETSRWENHLMLFWRERLQWPLRHLSVYRHGFRFTSQATWGRLHF